MTAADLDTIELQLDDGSSFPYWTDITLSDDFLTPCQTVEFTLATDETRFDVLGRCCPGRAYTVAVNGAPQITGLLDRRRVKAGREGTEVKVGGRDLLARIVDSNVDPSLQVPKEMGFDDFVQKLFETFGIANITIFEDYQTGRDAAVGKSVKTKGRTKGRASLKDKCKDIRPKDNEGGFQYFSRIAHRLGFHVWAMPDGSGVVVATPDYNQEASYSFTRTLDGGASNNILDAEADDNQTDVPSNVWVRGKGSAPGQKSSYIGYAETPSATTFKSFYVVDEESADKAHCDAYAMLILSRALRKAQRYEVTVRGASDPVTGRIYNVDTVANVNDQKCGVVGRMWVESRVIRKSRGGTETTLTLIPAESLLLDYYVSDSVPAALPVADASAKVKKADPTQPVFLSRSPELTFAWSVNP